jgi:hypothetical protein
MNPSFPPSLLLTRPFCHCRRKADEVHILEETIRARNEQHKKAGIELDATCHICLKTKFADGVGHLCNYCSIRCCARCGGKVTLRSNKVSREGTVFASGQSPMYLQHPLTEDPGRERVGCPL